MEIRSDFSVFIVDDDRANIKVLDNILNEHHTVYTARDYLQEAKVHRGETPRPKSSVIAPGEAVPFLDLIAVPYCTEEERSLILQSAVLFDSLMEREMDHQRCFGHFQNGSGENGGGTHTL